jgi:biotin carboxyl carrier protein
MQTSSPETKPHHKMSTRNRILFFVTAWLIVLMPFLFWWNTWFGRTLSDKKITEYLYDEAHPRHIQHALVQIGDRIARRDAAVKQWYPRVVQLASSKVDEVRNTDAWLMGQTTAEPAFHQALLRMLNDPSLMVRGNAALSLVRFGDATGRPQIVALLHPAIVMAPQSGQVADAAAVGTAIREGGLIVKVESGGNVTEVRSPITGRLRTLAAQTGQSIQAGAQIASVDPGAEQVWEALRALYLVGQADDIATIRPYTRETPDVPDHIRKQAIETTAAIEQRASKQP